jgi:hypothetical protein
MSSILLRKHNPALLQRIAIYAAVIAAFAMILGVSFGLGHARADVREYRLDVQSGGLDVQ